MGSSSERISFSSTTKPNGCLLQCEFKLPPRLFCKTVRCRSAFSTRPLRFKWADSEAQSAALSASPLNVHLPQFHRLSTRVNIYKCALNNICCGLGSTAWWNGAEELMGTYTVSGSIRSSFKCKKRLVPDVCHDATQMNKKLRGYFA